MRDLNTPHNKRLLAELVVAAYELVERWNSSDWKLPHTANYISRLSAAVGAVTGSSDITVLAQTTRATVSPNTSDDFGRRADFAFEKAFELEQHLYSLNHALGAALNDGYDVPHMIDKIMRLRKDAAQAERDAGEFVLVPRVPTEAMLRAGSAHQGITVYVWNAMLAVAPAKPPQATIRDFRTVDPTAQEIRAVAQATQAAPTHTEDGITHGMQLPSAPAIAFNNEGGQHDSDADKG